MGVFTDSETLENLQDTVHYAYYRAHRAVIFAVAQLSCLVFTSRDIEFAMSLMDGSKVMLINAQISQNKVLKPGAGARS